MKFNKLDENKKLSEIVKNAVKTAFDSIESKYELYTSNLEELECRSRDGFYSQNDGGWEASGFVSIGTLTGSGRQTNLPQEVQGKISYFERSNLSAAKESFKLTNKLKIEKLNLLDENINYTDLCEMGHEDLAESLSEVESEFNNDESSELMFQVRAMFGQGINENDTRTMYLSIAVNWEAPYFRSGKNNEWVKEEVVECSESNLESILSSTLKSLCSNLV